MIEGDEYESLVSDIEKHGLREPIVIYENQVLDGRGRLRACEQLGLEPTFTTYEGSEPFAYSISKNLIRRSLTASQKAAIAAEARDHLMEEAKERMAEGGRRGGRGGSKEPTFETDRKDPKGRSREIAGDMFGVGHAQVGRAWAVKEADPELFEKIRTGEMTVGGAYKQIEQKKKSQENGRGRGRGHRNDPLKPYIAVSKKTQANAEGQKRRLVSGLSEIKGISRALVDLDYGMAAAACSRQEIQEWAEIAGKLASALRDVRQHLLEVLPHAPEA